MASSNKDSTGSHQPANKPTDSWMSNLPASLHDCPLSTLAIPGSHNSGAFKFDAQNEFAVDASEFVRDLTRIPGIGPMVNGIMREWCKCQNLDISQQLNAGIRYFDLRVSTRPGCEDFYLVHSLYGEKVSELVQAVIAFLNAHPREIVLLDFNHFYAMEMEHHLQLVTYLITEFGSKLRSECECDQLTLRKMWDEGKQVIVFYQHEDVGGFEEMWTSKRIFSLWLRTIDIDHCIKALDNHYSHPSRTDFHVCQGILTPTKETIIAGIFGNHGLESMNKAWLPRFCSWVEESHRRCSCPLNIVIADFVEKEDFVRKVIDLNLQRAGH